MAVAGPNDLIGRARGLHALGKNESLSPRWLVTFRNRTGFSIPSTLPQSHDVGHPQGIFLSG
jgi:hypothetical protein